MRKIIWLLAISMLQNAVWAQQDANDICPTATGAVLTLIAKQFSFTEGASADRDGNIFFTDQPNNRIWKYDTHGNLSIFLDSAGRSNGMYFSKNGRLLTCADEKNEIWSISKKKKIKVLHTDLNGKKLNGPNDLWEAPNGDIYFTDPYYQRPYWQRTKPELEKQNVYLLRHNDHKIITVAEDLEQPNGIVGSADGKHLYVADIRANKTYRYTIENNGLLTARMLFAEQGSDGITLDQRGNLYLTGNGVTIFDNEGKQICFIAVPERTSNLAFGGKQKDQLFITAREAVYMIKMKVHGIE